MTVTTSRLHPDLRGQLREFMRAVETSDGEPALSEYKAMRIEGGLDAREHVAHADNGSIVGYAQAAWHRGLGGDEGHWAVEVVVAPQHRGRGVAQQLVESLHREAGDAPMTLWARAGYVADAARKAGWHHQRELLEMRRSLPFDCPLASFTGLTLTTFRLGVDEGAWLKANNAAFAGHPENGSMTRRDLEHRIARKWFDVDGFFLAWDGDRLAGSCWTKIHEDGVGEIYIVGVVPGWEGRGLGRSLVCHGLTYLSDVRHVSRVKLYVQADNERAVALYSGMGFETTRVIEAFGPADGA
ncbi:MAG: mycothiol synthase [Acidimicrobiia bacterium]|nr:mycothiol synthase [Acidimicrobiia bacterium]